MIIQDTYIYKLQIQIKNVMYKAHIQTMSRGTDEERGIDNP